MKVIYDINTISSNISGAIEWLGRKVYEPGDIAISRYWLDPGHTKIDKVVALGIESGTGSSCYRVLSATETEVVADIIPVEILGESVEGIPDFVNLVHSEIFIIYESSTRQYYRFTYESLSGSISLTGQKNAARITKPINVLTYSGEFYRIIPGQPYVPGLGDYWTASQVQQAIDKAKTEMMSSVYSLVPPNISVSNVYPEKVFEIGTPGYITPQVSIKRGTETVSGEGFTVYYSRPNNPDLQVYSGGPLQVTDASPKVFITVRNIYTSQSFDLSATFCRPLYCGIGDDPITDNTTKKVALSGYTWTGNLKNQKLWFVTPLQVKHIYDANGFDYLSDYEEINNYYVGGIQYFKYTKKTPATISGFIQKITYND